MTSTGQRTCGWSSRTVDTSLATRVTGPGFATSTIDWPTRKWRCQVVTCSPGAGSSSSVCGSATAPGSNCSTTWSSYRSGRGLFFTMSSGLWVSSAIRSMRPCMNRRTPMGWRPAGPPTGCFPTKFASPTHSPPSTSSRGCSRTTVRCAPMPARRRFSPSTSGRTCSTRHSFERMRCRSRLRSMSTTYMSNAYSPKRPLLRSADCDRGLPTNSPTMACAPTVTGCSAI